MDRRKAMVRDAYDAIGAKWMRDRRAGASNPRERSWIDRFLGGLAPGARVLDLGCGSGEIILSDLVVRGFRATGVDFSHRQVALARAVCPSATVLEADLAEVTFPPASFEGVIAYDSLWYIPREEQRAVFERIRGWLVGGGAALLTLGAVERDDMRPLFTDLLGAPLFYDAWSLEVSLGMLREAGLEPVDHHLESIDPARPSSGHLIVLARAI